MIRSVSDTPVSPARWISDFDIFTTVAWLREVQRLSEAASEDNLRSLLEVTSRPIQKSSFGINGPTLLVNYANPGQEHRSNVAYVLKWTDQRETAAGILYNSFISRLNDCSSRLSIPENSWYDFRYGYYMDLNGQLGDLNETTANALAQSFNSIPSLLDSSIELKGDQLIVMERIFGENLIEFARFKYKNLDEEQRKVLFFEFGKLAILDLLFGNSDRFFHLKWEGNVPELAFPAIRNGMSAMFFRLRENLIPSWRSDDSEEVRMQLNRVYPEFLQAMERRIDLFEECLVC